MTQVLPGIPSLSAGTCRLVSAPAVDFLMAVHIHAPGPLPPSPLIPNVASACLSLDTKRCDDDWRGSFPQSKPRLLADESSRALSSLVESLPIPQCAIGGDLQFWLTWRIGTLPSSPNIHSRVPDGSGRRPLLGDATRFQSSFKI
jgi:hypothetical protein